VADRDPDRSGKLFQGISALSALVGVVIALVGAGAGAVVGHEAAPKTVTETVTVGGGKVAGGTTTAGGETSAKDDCAPTDTNPGADYEPNDDKVHPYGPLDANVTYGNGVIDTSNDQDWFVFCTTGLQQLKLDFTPENDTSDGCYESADLYDADGNSVGDGEVSPAVNETGHITYTAPSAARYFVEVYDGNASCKYAFKVNSDHPFTTTVP
jgi:hypothetical protein